MNTESRVKVQIERQFDATPEQVFDAWLDPVNAGKWLFKTPAGEMLKVEVDPRVGGQFTIVEHREDIDAEHVGEYVQLDRPRRLVFDFWVPQYSADKTRISLDMTSVDGGTRLTLTHEGVYAEYADRTRQGWTGILDGLAKTLA